MGLLALLADTRQHQREVGRVAGGTVVAVDGAGQVEMDGFPFVG